MQKFSGHWSNTYYMRGSVLGSTDTKSRERPWPQSYRGQRQGLSSLVPWRAPFPALHLPFSLTRLSYMMPRMCLTRLCLQPQAPCLAHRKCLVNIHWTQCSRAWDGVRKQCPGSAMTWGQIVRDAVRVETIWVTISTCGSAWVFALELWVPQLAPLILESVRNVGLTFFK